MSKKRIYVHGDKHETNDSFYCSACDFFRPREHFNSDAHPPDYTLGRGYIQTTDYARYQRSLKKETFLIKNLSHKYYRPKNPENLFA